MSFNSLIQSQQMTRMFIHIQRIDDRLLPNFKFGNRIYFCRLGTGSQIIDINKCNSCDSMINNYRSRSFSFNSFQRPKPASFSIPHSSAIFTPNKKKQGSQASEAGYLGITYASPQQYYTNHPKDYRLAHFECHLKHSLDQLPNPSHQHKQHKTNFNHPQGIFERDVLEEHGMLEDKSSESFYFAQHKHKCIYNYFASLSKGQSKKQGHSKNDENIRPKPKSILLIRKVNRKKEQMAEKVKQKLESQFRNKKQIPIHHTQFHFNKRQKIKSVEHSPAHQQRKADFTHKIHRAVQEILRLRATLKNTNEDRKQDVVEGVNKLISIDIEGDRYFQGKDKEPFQLSAKSKLAKNKSPKISKPTHALTEENQIGPWARNSNDFQSLL